ncbi:Cardiolipin synthase [Candidatus Burarchaeum australiense]|nr:Cardiolipin synthase [Candidatus Burarchaeum australiense]
MAFRVGLFWLFIFFALGILLGAGFIIFASTNLPPSAAPSLSPSASTCPAITAIFSPGGQDEIVPLIGSASSSLDVEMYVFSYQLLADELISAQARGVSVRVLLEPALSGDNANLKMAETLRDGGVDVRWADPSRTNHAKFLIIDGKRVLVGSHNWSWHAMNTNREASVLVEDAATVSEFGRAFEQDWGAAYANNT